MIFSSSIVSIIKFSFIALCIIFCTSCNNELKKISSVRVYTLPETTIWSMEYGKDSLDKTHYNTFDDPRFIALLKRAKHIKDAIYTQGHIPALFIYVNGDSTLADVSICNGFFAVQGKVYVWKDSKMATEWTEIIYQRWKKSYLGRLRDDDDTQTKFLIWAVPAYRWSFLH